MADVGWSGSSSQHHPVRNAFGSAVPMGWEPVSGAPRVQVQEPPLVPKKPAPAVRFGIPRQQSTAVQSEDMRLQQLQSLLDFALKQKLEEDGVDATKIRQLEEIVLLKDRANKDLKASLEKTEEALADAKISLEHKHLQLIRERDSHEETIHELKNLQQAYDESQRTNEVLKEELERSAEQIETANKRVNAARKDALDRLHEEDEAKRALASVTAKHEVQQMHDETVRVNLGEQLYRGRERMWKRVCFHEWNRRLELRGHKNKTIKALESQFGMRRMLLWRVKCGQIELEDDLLNMQSELKAAKDEIAALEASRDSVVKELKIMEEALDRSQEEVLEANGREEELGVEVMELRDELGKIGELEDKLKAANYDAKVMQEELRLSNEMLQSVRMDQEAQEAARRADAAGKEAELREEAAARAQDREEALLEMEEGCTELGVEPVGEGWKAKAVALVEMGRREGAARRDREWMAEERQSVRRQLEDVARQLEVAEEENRLLRSLQLPQVARGGGREEEEGGEDKRDEAIVLLSEELAHMQGQLELLAANLADAMGRLMVTVVAGKGFADARGELMVRVRVDSQEGWSQGKFGAAPVWEQELAFGVSASTRELRVQVVERGAGSVGSGVLALQDCDLEGGEAVWVSIRRHAEHGAREREEPPAALQLLLVYRGPDVAFPRAPAAPADEPIVSELRED